MLPGPSGLFKPLIGMLWVGYIALIVVAISLGKLSIQTAIFQMFCVVAVYLSWSTGALNYFFSSDFHVSGLSIFTKVKGKLIQFCSSFFYVAVFLTFFCIDYNDRYQKALYFTIIAILSLIWTILLYKRIRLIEDTAQTQLSTAAQGYAEVEGKVRLYDNETARGPNLDMPVMAWYAKHMVTSTAGFILEDDRGRCTIDPNDAEVITPSYRYNDHSYKAIYPGEKIYVLGYLETLNKHRTEYERQGLVSRKMVSWKQNRFRFLDLFDRNNDGVIDDNEMLLARDRATDLVDDQLEEVYQAPATHVISNPNDGRPFILSSIHPEKLLKRYKISLWIHSFIWVYLSILVLAMQVG